MQSPRTPPAAENVPAAASEETTYYEERPRKRFFLLATLFMGCVLIVLAQLVRYQVFRNDTSLPQVEIPKEPAPRGAIVDRNGIPLVVNRYFYQVSATPNHFESEADREEVARQLEELAGIPYDSTLSILTVYAEDVYAILADAIDLSAAQRLMDLKEQQDTRLVSHPLQNIHVKGKAKRVYPQAELTAHLTGFVSVDRGGTTGLEEYYDRFLWEDGIGLLGSNHTELDMLAPDVRHFVPSSANKDLVLTIDRTIQWILLDELRRGLQQFKAQSGTIMVMEPQTGAILGMVNLPTYDPNRFETAQIDLFPNPAVSAQYEPGSVFKIVTVAAALDTGTVEPSTIFTDTGTHTVSGQVIFNSDRMAHGHVTVNEALARSLNVVTAQIAEALGADRFYPYVREFGFDSATNVDLSGEVEGLIKSPGHEDWSPADLDTNSFGQGIAVTPIQMLNATAAIANDGILMRPYVVHARIDNDVVQITEPAVVRQVLKPETAHILSEMMVEVVENRNTKASVRGYQVAGKSGTAQIPSREGYVEDETIVTFVGFAPADDPQFVILVKMDRPDPTINPWASQTAAPVFSRVAERLLDHMNIPPDQIRIAASAGAGE